MKVRQKIWLRSGANMKAATEMGQSQDVAQESLEGLELFLWPEARSEGSAGMREGPKLVLVGKRTFLEDRLLFPPACH
jgi:hypothetical protein